VAETGARIFPRGSGGSGPARRAGSKGALFHASAQGPLSLVAPLLDSSPTSVGEQTSSRSLASWGALRIPTLTGGLRASNFRSRAVGRGTGLVTGKAGGRATA
jgi:hypothetical protein